MRIYTILVSLVALISLAVNALFLSDRLSSSSSDPVTVTFPVLDVIDGDTFTVAVQGETRRVRLIGVDAPDPEKCLGDEAKERLASLVSGKDVALADQFTDPYGRIMANVIVNNVYINKILLTAGLGRMDYYQHPRREELKAAYGEARKNKLGIFSGTCISRTPPVSADTAQSCSIKGNVDDNTKKKIYFHPDCKNYSQVTIDTSTDDQWFCSEEEASAAGFTKSTTCD